MSSTYRAVGCSDWCAACISRPIQSCAFAAPLLAASGRRDGPVIVAGEKTAQNGQTDMRWWMSWITSKADEAMSGDELEAGCLGCATNVASISPC
jgi:hypothetical protein